MIIHFYSVLYNFEDDQPLIIQRDIERHVSTSNITDADIWNIIEESLCYIAEETEKYYHHTVYYIKQ